MTVYLLPEDAILFPDPEEADADGLLAIGGDLNSARLLSAYSLGIFPWYGDNTPILWWSPDPRLILFPAEFHLPRSMRRILNSQRFRVTLDRAFENVMRACAQAPRPQGPGTWIVEDMVQAYLQLHRLGIAHSVEAWKDGVLMGGLYGVCLGKAFFGESMFFREPNASKTAFVYLVRLMQAWGFRLVDCQQTTTHMQRWGAREIPRCEFSRLVRQSVILPFPRGRWSMPKGLDPLVSSGGLAVLQKDHKARSRDR